MNRRSFMQQSFVVGATAIAFPRAVHTNDASAAQESTPPPDLRLSLILYGLYGADLTPEQFTAAFAVLSYRARSLDVSYMSIKTEAERRLTIHLTGVDDIETAITTMTSRGLGELIDPLGASHEPGTIVRMSVGGDPWPNWQGTPEPASSSEVYRTIVAGDHIAEAFPETNQFGLQVIRFRLDASGAELLHAFTMTHIGEPMSVVLDSRVVSTPVIQAAIRDEGLIEGLEAHEAKALAIQLGLKPLQARVEVERVLVNPALVR